MKSRSMLVTGVAGAVVAAACCLTPALTLLLVAVGLSTWVGWIDYVALPAIGVFLGLAAYAVVRRRGENCRIGPKRIP